MIPNSLSTYAAQTDFFFFTVPLKPMEFAIEKAEQQEQAERIGIVNAETGQMIRVLERQVVEVAEKMEVFRELVFVKV
ncbi:hypothetical protein [Flammeovirga agarivorans]|uniref:Uncharacterized protein n=1 Tax=Flammeovirga agarivorans TaxID=2726742 RepID=A0A7X8XYI4_9BACT|nr:hypothetical protein [Flammeovirga agarivorans]NLR94055.1 hypothetical protein [Flammeovirga agarivorans]